MQLTLTGKWITIPPKKLKFFDPYEEPKKVICRSKSRYPIALIRETEKVIENYFPELNGIYLYSTNTAAGQYLAGWRIALNMRLVKDMAFARFVIAHELTHLVQVMQDILKERAKGKLDYLYRQKIPYGEKSCDIYVYARHPDLVEKSCYLECTYPKMNKENKYLIHNLAKKAINMRCNGLRTYIKWFEEELNRLIN